MTFNPLTRINELDTEINVKEGRRLIEQCIETGLTQWTSPKFQAFLMRTIAYYLTYKPKRFMRGILYARWAFTQMPDGVNAAFKQKLGRIASGQPFNTLGNDDDAYPFWQCCPWPARSIYCSPWNGQMFLWSVSIEADRMLEREIKTRQVVLAE